MLDCVRKTIAQDGVRALWKGFGPAMARVRRCSLYLYQGFARLTYPGDL